ncbi:hypothetical protein ABKN59_011383 [Abortiporus biennis]
MPRSFSIQVRENPDLLYDAYVYMYSLASINTQAVNSDFRPFRQTRIIPPYLVLWGSQDSRIQFDESPNESIPFLWSY